MKFLQLPFIFIFTICTYILVGQSCGTYKMMRSGAIFEMTHYDKKGKMSSKTINKVIEVMDILGGQEADVVTQAIDNDGEEIFKGDVKVKCANGTISVAIQNMLAKDQLKTFEDMEVKIEDSMLDYPSSLTSISVFKDGSYKATVYSGSTKLTTLSLDITERKIVGNEKITTPAGTFDVVKMSYKTKFKAIFSFSADVTEWWSPEYGTVKSESFKNGKSQGYSELTSIK